MQPKYTYLKNTQAKKYALVDYPNETVFFFTRKAASTLACSILFQSEGLLDQECNVDYLSNIQKYRINIGSKIRAKLTHNIIIDPAWRKVKFVRSPYYRSVSTYYNAIRILKKRVDSEFSMSFLEYLNMLDSEDFIRSSRLSGSNTVLDLIYTHSLLQYCAFCDHYCTDYIRVENIDSELKQFDDSFEKSPGYYTSLQQVRTKVLDPRVRSRKKIKSNNFMGSTKLNNLDVYDYYAFFNSETIELIEKIYHTDIIKYSYERPKIIF